MYIEVSASGKNSIEKTHPKITTVQLELLEEILNSGFEISPATMQNPANNQYENVTSKEVLLIGNRLK